MGKGRTFSDPARDAVYQTESDNEVYSAAAQQNSYNLGSTHFSDQSGIGNFSQAGSDQRKANLKGALFTGNIGFDLQTAVLDVPTDTIDLLEDSASTALSLVSTDRIVTLSAGTTADLVTITGAQRPGQRLRLYNTLTNTITIKHTVATTANTIRTPDAGDFIFPGNGVVDLTYDITTTQWRVVAGSSGGGFSGLLSDLTIDVTKDWLNFGINNLSSIQISDSVGGIHGLLQGIAATGTRLTITSGEKLQILDNITSMMELSTAAGLVLNNLDITTGTGNIVTGGAGEGMTNTGHIDFVDNLATPAAAVSLYSDGTDLFANTGGGVVNFSDVGDGVFPDNTFRITGSIDATKLLAFEVDGITTATTRTWTVPDASSNLVLDNLSNLNATTAVNVTLQADNDGLTNLGSFSFHWDEIFGRTLIFKEDKPVDATETAIGANASELWLNQTNAARPINFRWDNVTSYNFARTVFATNNPVLSWQLVNGATNTFSITDLGNAIEFDLTNYDHFVFDGLNHTRLELNGIGFTTAGLNDDEILFDSSNSTASDIVGQIHFVGHTDTAADFDIAKIVAINEVPTNASRSGLLEFRLSQSGTENDLFIDLAGFTGIINFRKELDMNNNKIADIGETTITDLTTATGVSGDFLMMVDATDGLMKKVDAVDFLGGGAQTPWTSNIDADGFDLTDLSNIEFRDTTGAPPTNVGRIWQDSSGLNIGSAAATEEIGFFLGAAEQIRFDEDGEILFVDDNHKIVPQTSSLQFTVNGASNEFQFQCGATSSNPNFIIEEHRLTLRTEDADTSAADLQLIQNHSTPLDDRTIGNVIFWAENTSSVDTQYAVIQVSSSDVSAGTEDGEMLIGVASAGGLPTAIGIQGGTSDANGAKIGFFGETPVVQQTLAASPTAAQISTVLEALGLTKFS